MQKLKEFLNAPGKMNYPLGLQLLEEVEPGNSLLTYLKSAPDNSFNSSMLRSTLFKLCQNNIAYKAKKIASDANKVAQSKPVSNSLSTPKLKRIVFEDLPENLQRDYLRRNDLVRQADIIKERIRQCPDQRERYNLGLSLLRTWADVRSIYTKLDNFMSPEPPKQDEGPDLTGYSLIELKALKQKAMVCRSKAKHKGNTTKYEYYEALIRHYNERIHVQI